MLNKSQFKKITQNYSKSNLEKAAKNVDKQIEALKDEKAINLILNAIQESIYILDNHHGKEVYYKLDTSSITYPSMLVRLNLLLNIEGEKIPVLLEELDGNEVCMNFFAKNKENIAKNAIVLSPAGEHSFITLNDSFEIKYREENFLALASRLLGKELAEKFLISIIEDKYHV